MTKVELFFFSCFVFVFGFVGSFVIWPIGLVWFSYFVMFPWHVLGLLLCFLVLVRLGKLFDGLFDRLGDVVAREMGIRERQGPKRPVSLWPLRVAGLTGFAFGTWTLAKFTMLIVGREIWT